MGNFSRLQLLKPRSHDFFVAHNKERRSAASRHRDNNNNRYFCSSFQPDGLWSRNGHFQSRRKFSAPYYFPHKQQFCPWSTGALHILKCPCALLLFGGACQKTTRHTQNVPHTDFLCAMLRFHVHHSKIVSPNGAQILVLNYRRPSASICSIMCFSIVWSIEKPSSSAIILCLMSLSSSCNFTVTY